VYHSIERLLLVTHSMRFGTIYPMSVSFKVIGTFLNSYNILNIFRTGTSQIIMYRRYLAGPLIIEMNFDWFPVYTGHVDAMRRCVSVDWSSVYTCVYFDWFPDYRSRPMEALTVS